MRRKGAKEARGGNMQESLDVKTPAALSTTTLSAAIALLLSGNIAFAQQEEVLEEVIVTGSFLPRAADSASPMSIISQEDMRYTPRSSIGEILHADPAFSGSNVFTSFGTGLGTSTSATINLRGLGPRARSQGSGDRR